VAFATMPMKNNVLIYEHIYRTAVIQHGIWDQLRVDHGTEFYLSLFVQEKLTPYRTNTRRVPFSQTSKQNHPAERKWIEFNTRVKYPIKRALNAMVNEDLINMDDDMNKFCVSWFTSRTADIGIKQVISSWNNHPIPGKGVPHKRMEENKKTFILPSIDMLSTSEEAVLAYEREDGHLSLPKVFGTDLLSGNQQLQNLHFDNFNAAYPSFDVIFHCLVNGNHYPFKEGLQYFIDLTTALNPN